MLLVCWPAACGEPERPAPAYTAFRHLMQAESVDVEVLADAKVRATATRAAELATAALGRPVRIVDPAGAGRRSARIVVGLPDSPGVAALLERLGVAAGADGFVLPEAPASLRADALVATLGDPTRPGHAVSLVCATEAAGLEPFVRTIAPAWRGGLRAYRRGDLVLEARASLDGALSAVELPGDLKDYRRDDESGEPDGLVVRVAPGTPERELLSWRRATVPARRAVARLFGGTLEEPVEVVVHAHAEDLRWHTRRSGLSNLNPVTGEVHVVVSPDLPHDSGFGVARSLAIQLGGRPAEDWMLDGIAAASVPTWWGKPKGRWIAFVIDSGASPTLEQLVDPRSDSSPHVLAPLRGMLFELLMKRLGKEGLQRAWRGELAVAYDAELQVAFHDALEAHHRRRVERLQIDRGERLSEILLRAEHRRGANLVPPPDPGYTLGFGTRACERSLDDLAAIGANSVGLAFRGASMRDLGTFAMEPQDDSPFMVSDLELVATAGAARARGLSTMFKPEILARPSGIRLGDVAAESGEDAEQYFRESRRMLTHAALVAELCEADVFCLGTELRHVTVTSNLDVPTFMQDNQQAWIELIAALRGSFMGALTYAADWRGEIGGIEFWGELDFIGVALYEPLSVGLARERPDDRWVERKLLTVLKEVIGEADSRYKPALICEVGFASTSRAWDQPDAARGDPDPAEQARMYEALHRVFRDHALTRDMFEGLYLWNWSTDPDAGREADHSFTPQNRPAREVAAQLFEVL